MTSKSQPEVRQLLMKERPTVVHIVGSTTNDFFFHINILYASSFDTEKNDGYQHTWAVVRPHDKRWAFTDELGHVVDLKSRKLIDDPAIEWTDVSRAMAFLANEIRPLFVVPHLLCYTGMTKCRYLHALAKL